MPSQTAVDYNRARFVFTSGLLDWVGRAAADKRLAATARASGELDGSFAQLVAAAQVRAGRPSDGRLSPETVRALRKFTGDQSHSLGLSQDRIVIPETQVEKGVLGYPKFESAKLGVFYVTGGFMEPHGHASKATTHAIFQSDPGRIETLAPADRNLGIDIVVANAAKDVRAWYGGLVLASGLDGGYGNRVTMETDVSFTLDGREFTVYQAYGHNAANRVGKGEFVEPGEVIATMGGTGSGGKTRYGEHVDIRTWIDHDGRRVDLSPNVLDAQLVPRVGMPDRTLWRFARVAMGATAAGFAVGLALVWNEQKGRKNS